MYILSVSLLVCLESYEKGTINTILNLRTSRHGDTNLVSPGQVGKI